jgi:hypothetical protein
MLPLQYQPSFTPLIRSALLAAVAMGELRQRDGGVAAPEGDHIVSEYHSHAVHTAVTIMGFFAATLSTHNGLLSIVLYCIL